jgi:pyruvate dehydrogenase complex dehydrogenase (E1) component
VDSRTVEALGTDGFGRSETRAALRDFFEWTAAILTLAALRLLEGAGRCPLEPPRARVTNSAFSLANSIHMIS